jgi:hypothetical protein
MSETHAHDVARHDGEVQHQLKQDHLVDLLMVKLGRMISTDPSELQLIGRRLLECVGQLELADPAAADDRQADRRVVVGTEGTQVASTLAPTRSWP